MASGDPVLYHRRLGSVGEKGPVCVLDAVGDAADGGQFQVFLSHGSELADVMAEGEGLIIESKRKIRGDAGKVLDCRQVGNGAPALKLVAGERLVLQLSAPEPELLASKNCLLSFVNSETTPDIARWIAWHVAEHGVDGVLLYNRLWSSQQADLAEDLKAELARLRVDVSLVVVDIAVQVGRTDLPDERHRLNAPDGPGKDRIETPPADPWRSTLADEVLIEHARWRFLRAAAGVSFLDISDYLAPRPGQETVFELARNAPDHTITLPGIRAYPWQMKNDGAPTPGDHVCLPFDIKSNVRRWVVAADLADGREQVWRPHRIIGLTPRDDFGPKFYRFMGMRHPDCKPAEIVPKSSLREDADLIRLSKKKFNYNPRRDPNQAADAMPKMADIPERDGPARYTIVTAMKNEGPFLLEWIAYHRAIGFTDFLVYTNDCTDGTDSFLKLLQDKGMLQHRENPFRDRPGMKPQHAALEAAQKEKVVKDADWLLISDVDEFVAVHTGDGTLQALFDAVPDANLISLTWRLFGNADIAEYTDDFLIRQFTRCALKTANKPHQAWGFKTLYRHIGIFRKLGVHRPKGLKAEWVPEIRWYNGSGQLMPQTEYRNAWRSNGDTVGYDLVTLNHYAVRSVDSFLVKRDRGRVNHTDRDQGLAYWFRMNHNSTEERGIQRMIPALQAEWDRLMADPEIRAAHEGCVAAHKAKIAELKADPDYQAFYEEISSTRMQQLSRRLKHFGRNVFLAGPQSVPDELLKADLPDDYFFTVDRPTEAEH